MTKRQVVICNELTKDYGSGNGLFGLNLAINQGEIFGLVGPNGAGKSTFIKLLMDLVKPTSGSARIFGKDTQRFSLDLKRRIGYLPGELMQFPGVTAGYILNLLLNLRGVRDRVHLYYLAERLQLDLTRKYQNLSHGNKQKVGLVQALMHKPELLILDEPTLGLDPIVQREVREILQEQVALGNTVILSSHIMSEVENICSRIGLIHQGKVLRLGTLTDLRTTKIHKVQALLGGKPPSDIELRTVGARDIEVQDHLLSFQVQGSVDAVMKLLSKTDVEELDSRELSLEEVFFSEVDNKTQKSGAST
jgi:ABC-2 type transport system ATP-binding protein